MDNKQINTSLKEENCHKIINKKNFATLLIIVVVILGLHAIVGGQKETQLSIPKFLEGAQISFDNQMYYQNGKQQQKTKTFKTIRREIVPDRELGTYYPDRFTYELVSTSTKFSIIGAINNAQYGLMAIDSGTDGTDFLILQDEMGNKSLIPYFYLYTSFSNGIQDALIASYYKNGKRIDYIHPSDFDALK